MLCGDDQPGLRFYTARQGRVRRGVLSYAEEMRAQEKVIVEAFRVLADSLRPDYGIVDILDRLVAACVDTTPGIAGGVVVADGSGILHVAASSSERTTDVEEAQLGAAAGPCLDCFASGQLVAVDHLPAAADKWPQFVDLALREGFGSAYAVPLKAAGTTLGSVNLFVGHEGGMQQDDLDLAGALTEVAAINIIQRERAAGHVATAEQLQRALDSRVIIEQAKGVIAQQRGIGIDAAFGLLRGHARNHGLRIHDVAWIVVERHLEI